VRYPTNVATELGSQSEVAVVRSYCFSPFFTRRVNLGMQPLAQSSPSKPFRPHEEISLSMSSKIRAGG
jgi:hypothetical protein